MTCIVGCVWRGKVYMGGDSFSGNAGFKTAETTPKLFKNGSFLFGMSGSWRLNQIISTEFKFPKKKVQDPKGYLIELMPEIQDAVDSIRVLDGEQIMIDFLVGTNGRLFHIQNDLAVTENPAGYSSAGMSWETAMAGMEFYKDLLPKDRMTKSLEMVVKVCPVVSTPFTFLEI